MKLQGRFSEADPFVNGKAAVKRKGKYGMIDNTGKQLLPFEYRLIMPFSEGLAAVGKKNDGFTNMAYLNEDLEVAIPYQFKYSLKLMKDHMSDMKNGRSIVSYDTGKGIIDSAGREILAPLYHTILGYRNGLTGVRKGTKWAVVNRDGELTTELEYGLITMEKEGPPRVFRKVKIDNMTERREGMVDLNGREVIEPRFNSITWMGDNLVLVLDKEKNERYYVDVMGNEFRFAP